MAAQGHAAEIAGQTGPSIAGAVYGMCAWRPAFVGHDAPLELVDGFQAIAQGFLAPDAEIAGGAADALAALDTLELPEIRFAVDL